MTVVPSPDDERLIGVVEESEAMTRLAWVRPESPHSLVAIEHWLPDTWRAGDVACFRVQESLPNLSGYLGLLGVGSGMEITARLRTRRRLRVGEWRVVTVVAHPREKHKHIVAVDSFLLKGRYFHLADANYKNSDTGIAATLSADQISTLQAVRAGLPHNCCLVLLPHASDAPTGSLRREGEHLIRWINHIQTSRKKHQSVLWRESPAYNVLRLSRNSIIYGTQTTAKQLSSIAETLWPETTAYIADSPTSGFSEFRISDQLDARFSFRGEVLTIRPNISGICLSTPLGLTVDLNLSDGLSSRADRIVVVKSLFDQIRLGRHGGRILIDIPRQLGLRAAMLRSLFRKAKTTALPFDHPVADDSWAHPCQRMTWETHTSAGLLVLQEQAYDRSLASIYGIASMQHHRHSHLIAHEILRDLPVQIHNLHRYMKSVVVDLPDSCHQLFKDRLAAAWSDCCVKCGIKIDLNSINPSDKSDWQVREPASET